jgi:hypothetical protein
VHHPGPKIFPREKTVHIHTTASWRARDDRRASAVWLGIFWIFTGFGFGFDFKNYVHESPPVPTIVHVHAIVATLWLLLITTLVLLVEVNQVKLHRTLGWFAAGFAVLVAVLAPWAQVSWQIVNFHTIAQSEFLSIAFSSVLCFAILLPRGVLLRGNPAAHRRVLILSTVAMTDPGFSRLIGLVVPNQTTFPGQYLYFFGGNLFIMLLMFAWDWHKGRVMLQFLQGACLILAVDLTAIFLFRNLAWKAFTTHWITSLIPHH